MMWFEGRVHYYLLIFLSAEHSASLLCRSVYNVINLAVRRDGGVDQINSEEWKCTSLSVGRMQCWERPILSILSPVLSSVGDSWLVKTARAWLRGNVHFIYIGGRIDGQTVSGSLFSGKPAAHTRTKHRIVTRYPLLRYENTVNSVEMFSP